MVLAPPSEGGWGTIPSSRWGIATFLYLSHSAVVICCESFPPCRTEEKEGDESDPPQRGGHVRPGVDARCSTHLSGSMLVALVLIYPCGKAPKQPPRRGAESTETNR